MKLVNLVGQRFGKLTVISRAVNSPSGKAKWICKCDCGNIKEKAVTSSDLVSGKVKSCGCNYKESNKNRNAIHSMTHSRVYNIWLGMRQRCQRNKLYLSKNIKVCDEWKNSFEAFYEWAIANGYSDELTLDRIDSNGNYEPSNCRWATMKQQQNNRTNNIIVSFNGTDYTVSELAERLCIPRATLLWRINHGWKQSELGITPNLNNKNIRRNL